MSDDLIQDRLDTLAKEIAGFWSRSERNDKRAREQRLAAALALAEARLLCEQKGEPWKRWCAENVKRSYRDVKRLVAIGMSPDPAAALSEKNTARRLRGGTVSPPPLAIEAQKELTTKPTATADHSPKMPFVELTPATADEPITDDEIVAALLTRTAVGVNLIYARWLKLFRAQEKARNTEIVVGVSPGGDDGEAAVSEPAVATPINSEIAPVHPNGRCDEGQGAAPAYVAPEPDDDLLDIPAFMRRDRNNRLPGDEGYIPPASQPTAAIAAAGE